MCIVSMTTIPSRQATLYDSLISILNQSLKFDKLCINIDDYMSFGDYNFYFGLEKFDSRIEVSICDKKWRSCNKLLPTIEKYPNEAIITVDDDILYPKDTFKVLFEEYEKNKDCIITAASNPNEFKDDGSYGGYYFLNDVCLKQKNYSKYMSLCSLFPPHTFDGTDVFDYDKMIQVTNGLHDELWFWLNSTLKGVKVITENNYLRNLDCYIIEDAYSDGYKLWDTNLNIEKFNEYVNRINDFCGEKLDKILSEKTEFVITSDNMYSLFYEWNWFYMFYNGRYVLNIENLTPGMVKELSEFLSKNGVNLDTVVK